MENEIILSKENKVLLIEVLKNGIMKREQAEQIAKHFSLVLTDEQLKKALEMIKPKNIQ